MLLRHDYFAFANGVIDTLLYGNQLLVGAPNGNIPNTLVRSHSHRSRLVDSVYNPQLTSVSGGNVSGIV